MYYQVSVAEWSKAGDSRSLCAESTAWVQTPSDTFVYIMIFLTVIEFARPFQIPYIQSQSKLVFKIYKKNVGYIYCCFFNTNSKTNYKKNQSRLNERTVILCKSVRKIRCHVAQLLNVKHVCRPLP
jgi:hypothetical protein